MNLVEYFSKYQVKSTKLLQRKKPVIVRTFPQYSSNPNSETYGRHCEFQFIEYKPWNTCPQDAWNHSDVTYVKEWKNFFETDIGIKLVPNWKRSLDDAFKFVSLDELREDEETVNESQQCEEWMYIALMVGPPQGNHLVGNIESEIQEMRSTFTNEQIASIASWLNNEKKNHICNSNVTTPIDISQLNDKQRFVYEIIAYHANSSEKEPLHLLITGQGRSGKKFVINSLRQFLGQCCVVASYFGIASHNINGVTLHSLLKLPIRGKNCCELKRSLPADMQVRMANI